MSASELSKSEYMMFLRHPAWLWLKKHNKKLLPAPSAALQARFDDGNAFEAVAESRFEGAQKIGFNDYNEYLSMPTRTQEMLRNGYKTILQARFVASIRPNSITCICDVVEVVGERTLDLYEIKASTSVKTDHIEDLAFQKYVLTQAGYTVRSVFVIHVNSNYVRAGEIDPFALSTQEDVTAQVSSKSSAVASLVSQAFAVVDAEQMPDPTPRRVKMGAYKDWLEIFLTLKPASSPYSIYALAQAKPEQIGALEDMHIELLADIPEDFKLKPVQQLQVAATRAGTPLLQEHKIEGFLSRLDYPLYFLDYETLSSSIPRFDGLSPNNQLPFQYSLHILDSPKSELRHHEYLHEDASNPATELTSHLLQDIGTQGTVLVWYEQFEKTCNKLLSRLMPEHATALEAINARIIDLMTPFSKGYFAHRDFFGSASIKKVLPVLVPELSYAELEISEGMSAQKRWMQAVYENNLNESDKNELMAHLRQYCGLDTLAMVRIYEYLVQKKYNVKNTTDIAKNEQKNKEFIQNSLF